MSSVVKAIFRRDLKRWFGNPTGYVFIALFVFLAAAALFWNNQFFQNNLANLDTLNNWFPLLLLFFIPAVTMSIWAGERGQGTDELLLTLPASDRQIILGKYLAACGIYTVALLFCAPLLLFLAYLGDPNWGLIGANCLGYWLLGISLLAAGMIGSQLSDNLTVAFILGALICGVITISEGILEKIMPGIARSWSGFGPVSLFNEMGRGIITMSAVLMFIGLIGAFLYMNRLLLGRRHWQAGTSMRLHLGARFTCLLVCTIALTGMGANLGNRSDLTSERIHSLSEETVSVIDELPEDRPVYIQAFISEDVPREYIQTRRTLLNLLRQYDALGGDRVRVRIVDTERYSEVAREADTKFGIQPSTRYGQEEGRANTFDIFMGVAFTCGLEEVVLPFLDKGLPVEYELTRSIRVVASAQRRKIGILDNDIKVFGGFDFQSMRQDPQWSIVRELELQYDVERVDPKVIYPDGLDVLIALMPSSLNQGEMDILEAHIRQGNPTLLIDDPFPYSAPGNAPTDPKGGPRNPMTSQGQPPPEPKGDIRRLLDQIGVRWMFTDIAWDLYNPHPQIPFEPEIVFVGASSGASAAFNPDEAITSGLQEVVTLFGGHFENAGKDGIHLTPLMKTSPASGGLDQSIVFRSNPFFGGKQINPGRIHRPDSEEKVLALRVGGRVSPDSLNELNVIVLGDLDMISEQFFAMRQQGVDDFQFDNVTFLLNCVDDLAKDSSFIDLRKRRPRHRTLAKIEAEERTFEEEWLRQKSEAERKAEDRLAEAQKRLDEKVASIRDSSELDEQSKQIQIESVRDVEQRRLDAQKLAIEDEQNRAIEMAEADKFRAQDAIRDRFRFGGLVLAPIPAILFGVLSLMKRRRREGAPRSAQSEAGEAS